MQNPSAVWNMCPDVGRVSVIRDRLGDLMRAQGWPEGPVGDAALLATEHAGAAYTVAVAVAPDIVRVEVRDRSTSRPTIGAVDSPTSEGGRGLALVAAYARRWGCVPDTDGKSVWFEIAA